MQQINPENRTAVLIGCIPFIDLIGKVRLTFREDEDSMFYQRRIENTRVKSIREYVRDSILNSNPLPIFPTSIILAFENECIDFINQKKDETVEINQLPDEILIVDGQHRFEGMKSLYERINIPSLFKSEEQDVLLNFLQTYRFNCSILINYDIWEQAQIFASVNFNQKKVNKSLFYDIYGIKAPELDNASIPKQNEVFLAHQLVKYLNGAEMSPFRGFVKMLGTGKGFISQAFLVEQFLKHLSPKGIWEDVVEDLKTGARKRLQNYAAAELSAFLAAVRHNFKEYWPSENMVSPSVLCKTTGIGAIMRFLTDLHNNMPNEYLEELKDAPSSPFAHAAVIAYFDKNFRLLRSEGQRYFSTEEGGEYNGTGGKGLQVKLYKDMVTTWKNRLIESGGEDNK